MQRMLGVVNFYRHFPPQLATVTAPLDKYRLVGLEKAYSEELSRAKLGFEAIKKLFKLNMKLSLLNYTKPLLL